MRFTEAGAVSFYYEGALRESFLRFKFGGAAHAAVNLRAVESHIFRPERDIFIDGLFKKLILRILETKPNPEPCGAQGALIFVDILAAEQNSAGIGLQKSV